MERNISYILVNKIPKRHAVKGVKRKDFYIMGVFVIILLIIINLPTIGSNLNNASKNPQSILTQATSIATSTGANLCVATKPLQVTEFDAFGSAFNAPTGIVYNPNPPFNTIEGTSGPSFSASGVATTSGKYSSGTALAWQFSGASQATEFVGGPNNVPFIVPYMTCGDTSTNNVLTIYGVTLGTYTISVSGQGSTQFTSGKNYYFSQFPGGASATAQMTVTLTVGTKNQGYKTSWDFADTPGLWQNMIVEIKDTSSNLALSGLPRGPYQFGAGTTRTWPIVCSDGLQGTGYGSSNGQGGFNVIQTGTTDSSIAYGGNTDSLCQGSLTYQSTGTSIYGASGASFAFGVAKGSLGSGSSETLSISMFKYGSVAWWLQNGVYGPNAVQIGAPVGSSSGTSFSLPLVNS